MVDFLTYNTGLVSISEQPLNFMPQPIPEKIERHIGNIDKIDAEVNRSVDKDMQLETMVNQAMDQALMNKDDLAIEMDRARTAEQDNKTAIELEVSRSVEKDMELETKVNQAMDQAMMNKDDLMNEMARYGPELAEQDNKTAIELEVSRSVEKDMELES